MVNASNAEGWVTTQQAAAHLGVSASFLFKGCASGTIPHARVGRSLRFRLSDLDAWASGTCA
jgi:excisionase family DNA binding protein